MAFIIDPAQPGGRAKLFSALAHHALLVWQDHGFRTALKDESWRFVTYLASEARAASLRVRG